MKNIKENNSLDVFKKPSLGTKIKQMFCFYNYSGFITSVPVFCLSGLILCLSFDLKNQISYHKNAINGIIEKVDLGYKTHETRYRCEETLGIPICYKETFSIEKNPVLEAETINFNYNKTNKIIPGINVPTDKELEKINIKIKDIFNGNISNPVISISAHEIPELTYKDLLEGKDGKINSDLAKEKTDYVAKKMTELDTDLKNKTILSSGQNNKLTKYEIKTLLKIAEKLGINKNYEGISINELIKNYDGKNISLSNEEQSFIKEIFTSNIEITTEFNKNNKKDLEKLLISEGIPTLNLYLIILSLIVSVLYTGTGILMGHGKSYKKYINLNLKKDYLSSINLDIEDIELKELNNLGEVLTWDIPYYYLDSYPLESEIEILGNIFEKKEGYWIHNNTKNKLSRKQLQTILGHIPVKNNITIQEKGFKIKKTYTDLWVKIYNPIINYS